MESSEKRKPRTCGRRAGAGRRRGVQQPLDLSRLVLELPLLVVDGLDHLLLGLLPLLLLALLLGREGDRRVLRADGRECHGGVLERRQRVAALVPDQRAQRDALVLLLRLGLLGFRARPLMARSRVQSPLKVVALVRGSGLRGTP